MLYRKDNGELMATTVDKLKKKFSEKNKYSNFGPVLKGMYIDGFRGINKINIIFDFPIIVISGLNGAGKSTLGQLAICGYKKPSTSINHKRHYVKDFFPISPADPKPISDDAKLTYFYETDDPKKPQEVTVSRANSAWSGYKRQPERHCYYVGFTVYIPKVERRDASVYGGAHLKFTEKRNIDIDVINKMAKIIGHKYDDVIFQGVDHKGKESEVGIATRLGYSYSENNMGFGEGRILYTIDQLENAPEQSLFILEEPETSLHESAQHEFAKYLLDVCNRRHHQIILSSHSSVIMNALPSESRKLITRDLQGVDIRDRLSSGQIRSILSAGKVRALDICVEDLFAKALLTEVIRTHKRDLLKVIHIHDIGDKNAVREAVKTLNKIGRKAIAIRDADVGPAPQDGLYCFPGKLPPEKEVYFNNDVQASIKAMFDIDISWLFQRENMTDHHKYTSSIAQEAEAEESVIRNLAINEYIKSINFEFNEIITTIEKRIAD